ncbi:MAG: MBOAT family protein [Candidatus Nanoarchaeia archaeon]|nr:MBOAT family protein [Candidatus Nanoarchaeia archaeon]
MMFNSIVFLLFFIIVVIIYYLIKPKYRWILLLISSYIFYMSWKIEYIILIIISTLIDYFMGLKIYQSSNLKKRKIFLIISLISNLGILFIFKYFNFFISSIGSIFTLFNISYIPISLKVLLPVGISFYTFQTMSYTIDVYRKKLNPEKHLGRFAVYVSFFPQLVAGPIERATNLLPQFSKESEENKRLKYENVKEGISLMIIGYFKKIVIADNLAIIVNQIYSNPTGYSSIMLIIATIFFSFQIYGDFSGYSDIARGISKIMGYDLMINFKRPYFAKSIGEFWKRWHISLSTWFRDYLYIPLGGNKVTIKRNLFNLFLVFLISGIWHGANYTFIIWGALNGIYLIIEKIYDIKFYKKDKYNNNINNDNNDNNSINNENNNNNNENNENINKKNINNIIIKNKIKKHKIINQLENRSKINQNNQLNNQKKINTELKNIILILKTYILTLFAWIFFRSNSLNDATIVIKRIFITFNINNFLSEIKLLESYYFYLGIFIIVIYSFIEYLFEKEIIKKEKIKNVEIYLAIIIFVILLIGNFVTSEFIYFQF